MSGQDLYWEHAPHNADMMIRVYAEARDHPVMAPWHAHWQRAAEVPPGGLAGREGFIARGNCGCA